MLTKICQSCRIWSRKCWNISLNRLIAKFNVDTAEDGPSKVWVAFSQLPLIPASGSTKQLRGRASAGSGEKSPGSPIPGAQGEPQDSQLSETYAARADCRTVVCATCYATAIIRYCESLWVACGATTRDPLGIMKMTTILESFANMIHHDSHVSRNLVPEIRRDLVERLKCTPGQK